MDQQLSWSDAQRILALGLVGAFVSIIILLIFFPLSPDKAQIVNTFVGLLGGMAGSVVTYYFGSSKGSADKDTSRDQTLTKLVNRVVTNGVPEGPKPLEHP